MQTYIQDGLFLDCTAAGTITPGQILTVGDMVGVTTGAATVGQPYVLCVRGVVKVNKTAGQAWAQGAKLYFNSGTGAATTTVGSNALLGFAAQPALSADTSGQLWLSN